MKKIQLRNVQHRFSLVCTGALLLIVATACSGGTSTPTIAPTPARTSTVSASGQPTKPPVAPSPIAVATTVAISPTVAPATAAPTRTTRPAATGVPASPKPSGVSGKLAYSVVSGAAPEHHSIWTAKADGSGASKILDAAAWPSFSPDGKKLAFYQLGFGGKNPGLYVGDAFGGNPVAAVVNAGACCFHWSRDGQWIVYTLSNKPNQPGGPIQLVKVDGIFKTVVDLKVVGNGPSFSSDGKRVVYSGCEPNTHTCGLRTVMTDGSGDSTTITRDNGGNADWSSGNKIVYQADDGAAHIQVFVVNPDGTGKKQLTTGKGNDGQPTWSRDGGSIFWRSDQNRTSWAIYVMNADGSNHRKIASDVPPDPDLWGWESLSIAP